MYIMNNDLKDKVILITGTSSGSGLATVATLLSHGACVFGADLSSSPPPSLHTRTSPFSNATSPTPPLPPRFLKACLERFGGKIDVLLSIAGIGATYGSGATLTDKKWHRTIATYLTASVKMMRAVVPEMKKNGGGGSIVNVASKGGTRGEVTEGPYRASKDGL